MATYNFSEIRITADSQPEKPIEKPKNLSLLKPLLILGAGLLAWRFFKQ